MNLTIGTNGLALIREFEGLDCKAVKLVGEKYYTIGYGHTFDSSIQKNTVWTKAQAEAALRKDLREFEGYVNQYVPLTLNQNQFDALVSYSYNRGLGGLKQLIANSRTAAEYAKNIVIYWGSASYYKVGLVRRRRAEQALFNTPWYPRLGAWGEDVRMIQRRLALCGWPLAEDGIWGLKTEAAVRGYQKQAGLAADGIVGPKTQIRLVQDAVVSRALELAAYLVKHKWHHKGNGYTAKSTFETTQRLDKPGCSCAHFVSWVLQDVGLLKTGKVISHSKAGYGMGKKAIVNADQLMGCVVRYPNVKIADYREHLRPGDVLVHDSSIGIYAPLNGKPRMLTGRNGQMLNGENCYVILSVTSGYEWKHNVLALVRAKS